jgi:hypothetical protein
VGAKLRHSALPVAERGMVELAGQLLFAFVE